MQKQRRHIKYINRDFAEFRTALVNYAKTYYPTSFGDFNESSPQMGFIEMCAYVGDVLSFYGDVQLQESFLYTVDERINLYNLAQSLGYKAKTVIPSSVDLEIFQLIPSIGEGNATRPDFRYALYVNENMQVSTDEANPTYFRTVAPVDFRFSSSFDPTTVSVYSVTDDGSIEYYLLKKKVKAISGQIQTETFAFGEPKIYDKIVIENTNVTEIISISDSDGNRWYEVPYMAQDLVPVTIRNTPYNDPVLSQYASSVPFILSYRQTEFRYVTRLRRDNFTEIQFGAGLGTEADEEIVPNPMNVGLGLNYMERAQDLSIDPMNFLYTRTYGLAPSNTTLTVTYATSVGLSDNVSSNTITQIVTSDITNPLDSVDQTILQTIRDSVSINNPNAAFGGQSRKPLDTIREEAMANFAAQNRSVTKEDYILRCFTMPARYGAIVKAYIEQDTQLGRWNEDRTPNPYSLNLYLLSYDANRNFVQCNEAIKENIRQYLRSYRLMTDAINIKDPFIINIGIDVEIITYPNENSNEVLLKVVEKLIDMFDNDKMGINQPILISKINSEIDKIDGVQTVVSVNFSNLVNTNQGYSGNVYDVQNAIRNGIMYPSVDPSIFEVKYPRRDIRCRVAEF